MDEEQYKQFIAEIKAKADAGDAHAMADYGLHLLKNEYEIPRIGRYKLMQEYLEKSAEKNDCLGQYLLALVLFFGMGVEKDVERAIKLCRKSFMKRSKSAYELLIQIHTYLELNDCIEPPTQLYQAIYDCWDKRDTRFLSPWLADDAIYIPLLVPRAACGKEVVLKTIDNEINRLSQQNVKPSFVATERYGTVVELFVKGYHSVRYYCKTNEDGKIVRLTKQPIEWGDVLEGYFTDAGSEPFNWNELKDYLLIPDTGNHKGHMFCMGCGRLSEELDWYELNDMPYHGYKYSGRISICHHCKQQVEFDVEKRVLIINKRK